MAQTGELAGSVSAVQMPSVQGSLVRFKARDDNAGNVYAGWVPLPASPNNNMNVFYRICDNAGDDIVYWIL